MDLRKYSIIEGLKNSIMNKFYHNTVKTQSEDFDAHFIDKIFVDNKHHKLLMNIDFVTTQISSNIYSH